MLRTGDLAFGYTFLDMTVCDFTLADYLNSNQPLETMPPHLDTLQMWPRRVQMWTIMLHITRGVEYLHSIHEVHRDLKPSNSTALELEKG